LSVLLALSTPPAPLPISLFFDKYPLGYEETRCQEFLAFPKTEEQTQQQIQKQQQDCQDQLENSRKQRAVGDITTALSTLASGLTVSLLFRRFIFS
jgi:hypothetical protein